jgi:hypothetical protein
MEAVTATGLGPYLDSVRNSTIWLPTDVAFQSANLASYNTAQLRAILMYHLTPNMAIYSTAMPAGAIPSGLQGQNINVAFVADGARVNDAAVDLADTFAANNVVIHIVNRVFVPTTVPEVPLPTVSNSPVVPGPSGSSTVAARATGTAKPTVSAKAKNSANSLASTGAGLTLMFVASLFL